MAYRGPGFCAVVWFGSSHTPSLPAVSCLSFSVFLHVAGRVYCTEGRGRGWGRSPNTTARKPCPPWVIQYSLHMRVRRAMVEDCERRRRLHVDCRMIVRRTMHEEVIDVRMLKSVKKKKGPRDVGWWVAKLFARLFTYGSSLGSNQDRQLSKIQKWAT